MRRSTRLGRASALAVVVTAVVAPQSRATEAPLIPALQIDGRGFGHGVGMAQDGALAMAKAGASTAQILGQFYPGTSLGKANGTVRVPVYAANNVELTFPDGGEVRGSGPTLRVPPAGRVVVVREGNNTRVRTVTSPPPSTTTSTTRPTTTTRPAPTTSTTAPLLPIGDRGTKPKSATPVAAPSTAAPSPAPATTTSAPPNTALYAGTLAAVPTDNGRVGLTPRGRHYRGAMEMSPLGGGVRFVNLVPLETYLRGMGEVRNPSWPQPALQAQAIAARTYAMRAMAAGGELCDTQRCQVYIGSDAEYAAMDKAVAASAGQVLVYGKGLASAVYSANGGGHSATRAEGFGLSGADNFPYLRAAPYPCTDPAPWSATIALRDVARHLNYPGTITGVEVAERGPSGRATKVVLHGDKGDAAVSGLRFDAALGLRSTLFNLRTTLAANVATVTGESLLQAPPEEAAAFATGAAVTTPRRAAVDTTPIASATTPSTAGVGAFAAVLLALVTGALVTTHRRARSAWHAELS